MRKLFAVTAIGCAAILALAGCGGGDDREDISVDVLTGTYGYQWTDTSKPILNETGRDALSFHIYSSKNSSAKDYNEMKIMQTLYEQTNVFVEWENVTESVYGQQKILKMGDHEGIDAIYHAGMSPSEIITYGIRSKKLVAINEYLEYMPNFSKILEERPDIKRTITSSDGNIYALPRIEEMGLVQNPNLLFLNKNWTVAAINDGVDIGVTAENVKDGIELTSTQMAALLTYFRDHDMNANGKTDDERPLTFCYGNWQGNQCDLYGMFGINDNLDHRILKDGQISYTVLDDKYYEATTFIHNWIDQGLIAKVSLEQTQDKYLAEGKGTELYGAFYWWESETVVSNPDNYVCCKPLKGPHGDQTVSVANTLEVSPGELIVFKTCPNVAVLLTYFDRYYMPTISAQINYGPIGIAFEEEPDANGKLVAKAPPADMTTDEVRLQNAPLGICYLSDYAWENVVEMEPRAKLRKERLALYTTPFYDHTKIQPIPNLPFQSQELTVLTNKEVSLNNLMSSRLINYLKDGVDQATWNGFIAELNSKSGGLNEVQQAYQNAYQRYLQSN